MSHGACAFWRSALFWLKKRGEGKKGWRMMGGKLQTKHKKGDRRRIRRRNEGEKRGRAETNGMKEDQRHKDFDGNNEEKRRRWSMMMMVVVVRRLGDITRSRIEGPDQQNI